MNGKNSLNKIIGLSVLVIGLVAGLTLTKNVQDLEKDAASDTKLSFTPNSQEVRLGETFTKQVTIDSGTNKITGIDLEIVFDPNIMNITELKPTSEIANFTTVIKNEINNSTGKLRYVSFTFDKSLAVSGKLNVLTILGSVPQSSTQGTYQLNFSQSSIVAAADEGQNVITEMATGAIVVIPGEPNSCGGTCGSNSNCKENLYCYQGYCRNPSCSDSSDCNCNMVTVTATPTPTPIKSGPTQKPAAKITSKPKATITSTTKPIDKGGNFNYVPEETIRPEVTDSPIATESPDLLIDTEDLKNQGNGTFVKYVFGILAIAICGIIYAMWKKNKRNIPHILPPTNI